MDNYPVLLNTPWINHSLSGLAGWSITVTASTGTMVIAALALLVQISGEATWTIAAFALHQARATEKAETGLFRQSQVLLRNPSTSLGTGIRLIQVGWKWQGVVNHALLRCIGLALIPVCLFGSFVAAGILVSRVTTQPNDISQVLLWPTNCGIQNWNSPTDQDKWSAMGAKWSSDIRRARAYATDCYCSRDKELGCNTLPVQQLPYKVSRNVICPVSGRCFAGTIQFDTGLLDSHEHLGINSDRESRIEFQMVTTCAPINISDTLRDKDDPYISSDYTNDFFLLQTWMGSYSTFNYTYELPTYQSVKEIAYQVAPRRKMAGPGVSSGDMWRPYPEFRLNDKDLTIALIIFNNVMYDQETYDPVFSADGTYQVSRGNLELNLPDHWFSAIACADQLRICDSNPGGACSPLTGGFLIPSMGFGLTEKQVATAERIIDARLHSTIFDVIYQQGGNALMASDLLSGVITSPALPRDQWILETTKWFQTAMANVQYRIVEFPNNEWDTNLNDGVNVIQPEDWFNFSSIAMRDLCSQQLVRSSDEYQTFSLEGIVIVIVISVILIIISCTLEWCVFQPKRRHHPEGNRRYKRLAYAADGQLQLLRVVLEKEGYVDWHDKLDEVPFRLPKDSSNQRDIRSSYEEPQSFQMRNMQRPSGNAGSYGPSQGYHQVSNNYGWAPWPDPNLRAASASGNRPGASCGEDAAPLLYGR